MRIIDVLSFMACLLLLMSSASGQPTCIVSFDLGVVNEQADCEDAYVVDIRPNGVATWTDVTDHCAPENPLSVPAGETRSIQCVDETGDLPPRFTGPHEVRLTWCGQQTIFSYGGPAFVVGVVPINWDASDPGWSLYFGESLRYFVSRPGIAAALEDVFVVSGHSCDIDTYDIENWGTSLADLQQCVTNQGLDTYPLDQVVGVERRSFCYVPESYFLDAMCPGADDWNDPASDNDGLCRHAGTGVSDLTRFLSVTGITNGEFNDMCAILEDTYDLGEAGNDTTLAAVNHWLTTPNGQTITQKINDTVWEDEATGIVRLQTACEVRLLSNVLHSIPSPPSEADCPVGGWVPSLPATYSIMTQQGDYNTLAHEWGHAMGEACDLYDEDQCNAQIGMGCQTGGLCASIGDCGGGTSVDVGGACSIMGSGFTDISGLVYENPPTLDNINAALTTYMSN